MEQHDHRFQIETVPAKELMKEGYRVVIYRTWNGMLNIGLAVLCLGIKLFHPRRFCARVGSIRKPKKGFA